jgi:hypothetical protein
MDMGDTGQMMAEVEVWQDRISAVEGGAAGGDWPPPRWARRCMAVVDSIGLMVGRQGLISDDAAENKDARVIRVLVAMDAVSSDLAARFTNLEVIARIDTKPAPGGRAMSRLLQALFGRLPIGWLQLTHSRTRFAAALAGRGLCQCAGVRAVGHHEFDGAYATLRPYEFFQADIMISAGDANAMADGGNVARQWLLQAMADPDVVDGMGLFVANVALGPGRKGHQPVDLWHRSVPSPAFWRPKSRATLRCCRCRMPRSWTGWRAGWDQGGGGGDPAANPAGL